MSAGFSPVAGKDFTRGDEPEIAKRLDKLAKQLGVTIYGISGARTPAESAALPLGNANDPHTRGQAADIGVNSQLRSSAGRLTEAQLNSVGLTRPFGGADEINHVQLLKNSGGGGGGLVGDVGGAIGDAAGAVTGVFGDAANAAAKALVGGLLDSLKNDGAKFLLQGALILGGAIVALYGFAQATGVHPVHAAGTAAAAIAAPETGGASLAARKALK